MALMYLAEIKMHQKRIKMRPKRTQKMRNKNSAHIKPRY
jgi:hypothetical protein